MHNIILLFLTGLAVSAALVPPGFIHTQSDTGDTVSKEIAPGTAYLETRQATTNLFVSAEKTSTDNNFGGPMVVEIVVNDPDLSETGQAEAQPSVTVNGEDILMVQASDGNWYAYIAHETVAKAADNTPAFDFGDLNCTLTGLNGSIADDGYFCASAGQNVVREPKALSTTTTINGIGQVSLPGASVWPIIQLFDFADEGDVDIIYSKGGSTQQIDLTYTTSMDDYSVAGLDRESYTQNADVHITVDDMILNIDPTDEDSWTFDTANGNAYYQIFDENGIRQTGTIASKTVARDSLEFGDAAAMLIDPSPSTAQDNLRFVSNNDQDIDELASVSQPVTVVETQPNSGIFKNTDEADRANVVTARDAVRETAATIDYNDSPSSLLIAFDFGSVEMSVADGTWNSGERLDVVIRDDDMNRNSLVDEDFAVSDPAYVIPAMRIGSPSTLASTLLDATINTTAGTVALGPSHSVFWNGTQVTATVTSFSDILVIKPEQLDDTGDDTTDRLAPATGLTGIVIHTDHEVPAQMPGDTFYYLNYDIRSLGDDAVIDGLTTTTDGPQGLKRISAESGDIAPDSINGTYTISGITGSLDRNGQQSIRLDREYPIVIDIFVFGHNETDRYNNAIYRLEPEENGQNTGLFAGTIEYIMLNQINALKEGTYSSIDPIGDSLVIIINEDYTGEDSPRLNYIDVGADGVATQVADQQEAPAHTGRVGFDSINYRVAQTATVTLEDQDLDTDAGTIDIYTVMADDDDPANDMVGEAGYGVYSSGPQSGSPKTRLLDIAFDGIPWVCDGQDEGLSSTNFALRETSASSGRFQGSFQVPVTVCSSDGDSTTDMDMMVNYLDFRNAAGQTIATRDSAGIRASTGSVSFDRTVYPVPWGENQFPLYRQGYLPTGNLSVHVTINDPDFDTSASVTDRISVDGEAPVKVTVTRGSAERVITSAGNSTNPIVEIAPDAGVFELDVIIGYNSGPVQGCPASALDFSEGCILEGDRIEVEYVDSMDASGGQNTVTASAILDLRDGDLQTDKSVYMIGRDIILTLVEPDFDLDADVPETYTLDLINWDSDAYRGTMGERGGRTDAFNSVPPALMETGPNTGIFQTEIQMPRHLDYPLAVGEQIELEYHDWGPAGASHVGDEKTDVGLTIFTSDFGAIIELDQRVYTWTDRVYITIVAPDYDFDPDRADRLGGGDGSSLNITTSMGGLEDYALTETGQNSGVFNGEITLTGFTGHDADGDGRGGDARGVTSGQGPTGGRLAASGTDTLQISFGPDANYSTSAYITWNTGEVGWVNASYRVPGPAVVRVIDPDMNLNPGIPDRFEINVTSDSDAKGVSLTVMETREASGIFEGTVRLADRPLSTRTLWVSDGDTITARYVDHTLPGPYLASDHIEISATAVIGDPVTGPGGPGRNPMAPEILINRPVTGPVTDTEISSLLEAYMSRGLVAFVGTFSNSEDAAATIPAGPGSGGFLLAGIITDTEGAGITDRDIADSDDITVFIRETGNAPPVLSTIGDYTINARDTLTFRVSATNFGNDTVSYLLVDAPGGATISGQGIFSWTPGPADVDSHTFVIAAYDDRGGLDRESVTVRVLSEGISNRPPVAPNITATVAPNGLVTIVPAVSDPDGDRIDIIGVAGDADGAIMPSEGRIEYVAGTTAGTETITYAVSDSRGAASIGTITVNIQGAPGTVNAPVQVNSAPRLDTIANMDVRVPNTLEFTVVAGDMDGDILTYHLAGQPAGATMNATGGEFVWRPAASQAGSHTFTVIVTDGHGSADFQNVTVRALPATTMVSIPAYASSPGCEVTSECYIPSTLTVNVGDTAVWSNVDQVAHTVTSGTLTGGIDGIFDSGLMSPGTTFEFTPEESGTHDYFCVVHPWMTGTVHVLPGISSADVSIAADAVNESCADSDTCLHPSTVTIDARGEVTWTNNAGSLVSLLSGTPADANAGALFQSGPILDGQTYTHTFEEAGTYFYYSSIQPWMTGTVLVAGE